MTIKDRFLSKAKIGLLALPLVLAACENEEERAERMQKVEDLVSVSLEQCDLYSERISADDYDAKLSDVLDELSYTALEYFENQGITLCLDARMQDIGDYSRRNTPVAIYHPEERVMAINTAKLNYAPSLVSKFARSYEPAELNTLDDIQMGVRYLVSTGKSLMATRRWRDDASGYVAIQENPHLLEPPLLHE